MKPSIVIWDWNGTVLDDLGVSLDAVNYILEKRGLPPIDKEKYYMCLDTPIIKFYECLLDLEKVPFSVISREFNEYYRANIEKTSLTPGVLDVIDALHKMKVPQIILSASHYSYIEAQLKNFGIEHYFEKVLGAEDYLAGSKVERAVEYMEGANIPKEGRLLIGDSCHDYESAKAIGAGCILLTSGHEGIKKLSTTGARIVDILTLDTVLGE